MRLRSRIRGAPSHRLAGGGAGAGGGVWPGWTCEVCTRTRLEGRASEVGKGRRCRRPGVWVLDSAPAPAVLHPRTRLNALREAELCGPVLQANPGTLAAEIG